MLTIFKRSAFTWHDPEEFSRNRFCLYFVFIFFFLRKMFKTKDAILPALTSYSKGRGANPMGSGGVGCAESSAVAQLAISVFLSQKNKSFVRT